MKNVIFIAPPASGKGTISEYLVDNFNYNHLSTGDILRSMAKSESELGKKINELMINGRLIGDDIILPAFESVLKNNLDKPFILDGMPRNLNQAKYLDNLFNELNINNYCVIYLSAPKSLLESRVTGRRICPNCSTTYNENFPEFKPKETNLCDKCKTKLIKRVDDSLETYQKRYEEYIKETEPVLKYYEEKQLLKTVDVSLENNIVINNIINILKGESND